MVEMICPICHSPLTKCTVLLLEDLQDLDPSFFSFNDFPILTGFFCPSCAVTFSIDPIPY